MCHGRNSHQVQAPYWSNRIFQRLQDARLSSAVPAYEGGVGIERDGNIPQ
jgi:hypothetical protein